MKIGLASVLCLLALTSASQAASIITVYNRSTDTAVTTGPNGTATTTFERNGNTVTATTTMQRNGYQPTGAGGYRPMGGTTGAYNPMGSR